MAEDIAKPKVKDVHELVRLCAGKLVPVPSARIIIANKGSESKFRSASSSSQIVTSNWLLGLCLITAFYVH